MPNASPPPAAATIETHPEACTMITIANSIEMLRPPVIEFGVGTLEKLNRWRAARKLRRTLIVADAFNGSRATILNLGDDVEVFGGVVPEPDIPCLETALAAARGYAPDLVVGFGGGSAMDIAKLVAVLCNSSQTLAEDPAQKILLVERRRH